MRLILLFDSDMHLSYVWLEKAGSVHCNVLVYRLANTDHEAQLKTRLICTFIGLM